MENIYFNSNFNPRNILYYKRIQNSPLFSGITHNVVGFYKKGNKIHIKKENKGKFTEYCGGKVTSECIQRGKHSSDPKIRKRATFAQNARSWKHSNGGSLLLKKDQYLYNPFKII